MSQYEEIRESILMHMRDADKCLGTPGNPGPTPGECYHAAHAVNFTAYRTKAITQDQWVSLGNEIRSHQSSAR